MTVDAFNQSGYTKGTSIAPVIAQKSHPRFYEAENGHLAGGAQASGKFVGHMHKKGASCTLTVDGGSGGSFDMNVLYSTPLNNAFSSSLSMNMLKILPVRTRVHGHQAKR